MHGSLVTSSLIRETTENESANEGYRFGQVGFGQKKQMIMPVIKAQRVVGDDVDGSNGRRSAMVF
jgi:photosystem I subunit PsaN